MKAIEIVDLKKVYKDKVAVENLNLTINQGELFSLLGVNGAGKTTTIKMLSCLSKPTAGEAFIMGESILKNTDAVKQIINTSPQETAVAPNLTVKENLEFIAGVYGSNKKESCEKAEKIIKDFSLEEIKNSKAKTLSGGWQRRLSIAMALITNPQVLFLDEPTLGLDVLARRELWKAISNIKGKITIVLTTHYMEEAEALSDRIAVMVKGELKALGTVEQLTQQTNTDNLENAFIAIAEEN